MTRPDLKLLQGGKADPVKQERRASSVLYPTFRRVVRAELRPDPNPPRTAA